eukprot:scaffold4569_cov174-Skeletonema_marinoi.AAC.2
MSVAGNIQHTARNLTSELPFIVQILGNGMRNLSCWRSSTFDNQALEYTGMRRVLDLNACRYDVYSCTHNDSESQNGSAGLKPSSRSGSAAHAKGTLGASAGISDTVAEWLRRSTRNRLGLSRVGSSPASVVIVGSEISSAWLGVLVFHFAVETESASFLSSSPLLRAMKPCLRSCSVASIRSFKCTTSLRIMTMTLGGCRFDVGRNSKRTAIKRGALACCRKNMKGSKNLGRAVSRIYNTVLPTSNLTSFLLPSSFAILNWMIELDHETMMVHKSIGSAPSTPTSSLNKKYVGDEES